MNRQTTLAAAAVLVLAACQSEPIEHENRIIDLWAQNLTAFGVYVPNETPPTEEQRNTGERPPPTYTRGGGFRLAQHPLYDFVFLNLEGGFDLEAVRVIARGLRAPGAIGRKTLLVRIPSIESDGALAARQRVHDVLDLGADGVVLPHVRSAEEARLAMSFFAEARADVWSPSNPTGEILAMIMIEDPGALAEVEAIADTPGISILACGIGSLTRALGGDREAAEAGNQEILSHAKRVGLPDMITANASNVAQRIEEGFLALLMQGPSADEVIEIGRAAGGR
ncbi:MAG: aldolase/citrate lyase family protein [Gemmatimonadetes bacterium]|nr:aldolase/citrate lyase family protein [Gemmatimonadota bacterium]